ncbi:flagellar protein FlaG [Thermovibrio guaymasensis]|uniref:Flagellar protein FlaG n=1 Tax=Thermovibrio guaymasensis TaxID=240167 RepID=A0A420W9U2_9BACT|nr:flagellar protein FlaG [Thermovibrio guaymasensis]RKQ64028.1 flagellar protein FlaG [Thermovibrio guaymasensis]
MEVKQVANLQASIQMNLQSTDVNQIQNVRNSSQQQNSQVDLAKELEKSPEVLEKLVEELKKKLSMLNTQLQITIDKDTDITVVKVIDKQTNKVIRQIPPEYVLKIAKYLDEIAGLLLQEKA